MTLNEVKLRLRCSNTVKKQKPHSVMLSYDSGTIILHKISVCKPASIIRIQHMIYNGYASMKTFKQTGTHTCTHTNIHTHDPMPTHTLTFHPYGPLSKPSELAAISIFSQHQTN